MHVFFCSPFVATAEPAAQPISVQTALLIILGIALVFAFSSLARLHRKVDALHAARAPRRQTTPVAAPCGDIPPEIVAVISAAVHESLGEGSHIVAINLETQDNTWSLEGRRQIFSSRKTR